MVNFGTLRRTWLEKIVTFHDCKHEKYCTEIYLMSMMMLILMMLVVLMVLRAASARGGCPNLELVVLRGKSKVGRVDGSRGARRNQKVPKWRRLNIPRCRFALHVPRTTQLHSIGEMHYKETCKRRVKQSKIGKHTLLAKMSGPCGSFEQ